MKIEDAVGKEIILKVDTHNQESLVLIRNLTKGLNQWQPPFQMEEKLMILIINHHILLQLKTLLYKGLKKFIIK